MYLYCHFFFFLLLVPPHHHTLHSTHHHHHLVLLLLLLLLPPPPPLYLETYISLLFLFFFFLGCYSFLQCKYGLISCRLISIIRYEPLFITSCHPYQPIHIVTLVFLCSIPFFLLCHLLLVLLPSFFSSCLLIAVYYAFKNKKPKRQIINVLFFWIFTFMCVCVLYK